MNDNPYLNEDTSKSGMAGMSGFMLGALVGAGVALLFAPAAGSDTRRKLGDTAKRLGSAAKDKFQEGKSQIQDKLQESKNQIQDRFQGSQGYESGSQGSSTGSTNRPGESQYGAGRREPVPSGSTNPGQTGTRPAPGRTTP
ncbi:MAG: YtxH domain-containing protein [Bacteroidota bacterium]